MNTTAAPAKRMLKHSTIYAIGNIARQTVGFLMLPIYTRFLTPGDYGVVGLLTFAVAIMEPFFGARLGEAMPKYYFEEQGQAARNAVISTALIITGAVSALTALAFFFFREGASELLFGSSQYALALGLFGTNILSQAIEYYGLTYIRILQRPKLYITSTMIKLAFQIIMNLALVVWLKMGVMGVVLSGVVSCALSALILTGYVIFHTGFRFDARLARAMLSFSWPLWFVGLASLYIYSGNRYFIRIFSTLDDVGLYELATKFASLLFFLVWIPFNQFWETERFNYYRQPNNQKIFSSTFTFISTALVAIALCIGIGAEPVIRIMAASEFHDAYFAVPLLTLAFLLSSLNHFVNFSFLVRDRTHTVSYISYIAAALITVANLALIPLYGYIGAAAAMAITFFIQFLISHYKARALYNMGLNLRPLMLQLALLSITFTLSTFVFRSENIWLDILGKCLLLMFSLGLTAALLWKTTPDQAQLRDMVSNVASKFSLDRNLP